MRSDAKGTGANASAPGGADSGSSMGPLEHIERRSTMALHLVLEDGPWAQTNHLGLDVDPMARLFIRSLTKVYVVEDGATSQWLTAEDVFGVSQFSDIGLDSDGRLYILGGNHILRSERPHEAAPFREMDVQPDFTEIAIATPDLILALNLDGLWTIEESGHDLRFDRDDVGAISNSSGQDIAVHASGAFVLVRGGTTAVFGNLSSKPRFLFRDTRNAIEARGISCITADPAGGYVAVIQEYESGDAMLMHFDESPKLPGGYQVIPTDPTLASVTEPQGTLVTFDRCGIAVGTDGTVWLESFGRIWRLV